MARILTFAVAVLLAASLAAPATAMAKHGNTYQVSPSSGDDTAAVQAALNNCVGHDRDCTVQLGAGVFHTSQLVTYGFQGTFKGAGQSRTTIEALPDLTVKNADALVSGECMPNTTTCRWPSLIVFVDGSIAVSDLAIHEPWVGTQATTGWTIGGGAFTALLDGLRFMGQRRTDVSIDRIAVQGAPDASDGSFYGYSLGNGVIYTGELPRSSAPFDYYWLSGSLSVRNSSFTSLFDGVSTDGFSRSLQVTIGGSPRAGNDFSDVNAGIDLEASQGSTFDVSYNTSTGNWDAMWVVPWQPVFTPSSPSQYLIHDNTFLTAPNAGAFAQGVLLQDDPANPWIRARVWNNTIRLQAPGGEGIDATFTTGLVLAANTISGSDEYDAIGLFSVARGAVTGNNVGGVTLAPDSTGAQVYVGTSSYGGDPSTNNLVVCARRTDTVLDQGTGDKIIGCTSVAAPTVQVAPVAPLVAAPGQPPMKPHLP